MEIRYFKEYSRELSRDMEFKVFGHGGRVCVAFPPQNGRFYDLENFRMVDAVAPWLEDGRVLFVCADGIDGETWSDTAGDPRRRLELHERWVRYITEELLPWSYGIGGAPGRAIATGCSMGAAHAANLFFRRPDKFGALISLSGIFDASFFFGDYMDDLVYENSPLHFLPNMPADHPYMDIYRRSQIILCSGQGAWDEEMVAQERRLEAVLREKDIPAWADYWGPDVSHDWPWWRRQLPYFFSRLAL